MALSKIEKLTFLNSGIPDQTKIIFKEKFKKPVRNTIKV